MLADPCQEKVPEDDRKKTTAAEHGEKSCKRTGPKQEAVLADPCQEKVPEDDRKKKAAAEHGKKSCKRTGPKQDKAPEDLEKVQEDDRKTEAGTDRPIPTKSN